jgi:hypothetical protein
MLLTKELLALDHNKRIGCVVPSAESRRRLGNDVVAGPVLPLVALGNRAVEGLARAPAPASGTTTSFLSPYPSMLLEIALVKGSTKPYPPALPKAPPNVQELRMHLARSRAKRTHEQPRIIWQRRYADPFVTIAVQRGGAALGVDCVAQ